MLENVELKNELVSILKDNLFIQVESISKDINIPFGPVETVKVSVYFGEELIDTSSCVLPSK